MKAPLLLSALMLGVLTVAPAQAQQPPTPAAQPETWVQARLRQEEAFVATAAFDNGLSLIAQCKDNVFDFSILGLPPADRGAKSRGLILILGDGPETTGTWSISRDRRAAVSRLPAVVARRLIPGGRLQIVVPARAGERRTRYVMDLRPSTSALQSALTGCGLPTESPQDAELRGDGGALPMEFHWVQRPGLDFPTPTGGRWPRGGTVTLSCAVMDNGRLRDCRSNANSLEVSLWDRPRDGAPRPPRSG